MFSPSASCVKLGRRHLDPALDLPRHHPVSFIPVLGNPVPGPRTTILPSPIAIQSEHCVLAKES